MTYSLRFSTLPLGVIVLSVALPFLAADVPLQTPPAPADAANENARYDLLRWRERIESDSSTFTLDQQLLLRTATAAGWRDGMAGGWPRPEKRTSPWPSHPRG